MSYLLKPLSAFDALSQTYASYLTGAVITASGVYADELDWLVAFTR
jgi:hypothetical protein